MMDRRTFLGLAGGVAAGSAAAGAGLWAALLRDDSAGAGAPGDPGAAGPTTAPAAPTTAPTTTAVPTDRVLVVLQLGGGNDGLDTLVPASGRYRDLRPTLAVAEDQLVRVRAEGHALHPALAPLAARWDVGQIAALTGIGLRAQTRSHFTAMDTWWAGTDGAASTTGWLGRWLDATHDGGANPMRAISLGAAAPALIGQRARPTVVLAPAQFGLRLPRRTDTAAVTAALLAMASPVSTEPWTAAAQHAIPGALDAIRILDQVKAQAAAGIGAEADGTGAAPTTTTATPTAPRPAADSATTLLQGAAGLIELDLGTRVILVGIGGFDTHADQTARHAALLDDVARGVAAFFDRLERRGIADRVLLLTTSEFGRRVAENASGGTDHGLAGTQFTIGPAVRGGRVVGESGLDRLVDGDLPIGIDARSLYAVGLDWLGGPTDELLGGRFDRYGLL